jgi:hypothetical protein
MRHQFRESSVRHQFRESTVPQQLQGKRTFAGRRPRIFFRKRKKIVDFCAGMGQKVLSRSGRPLPGRRFRGLSAKRAGSLTSEE